MPQSPVAPNLKTAICCDHQHGCRKIWFNRPCRSGSRSIRNRLPKKMLDKSLCPLAASSMSCGILVITTRLKMARFDANRGKEGTMPRLRMPREGTKGSSQRGEGKGYSTVVRSLRGSQCSRLSKDEAASNPLVQAESKKRAAAYSPPSMGSSIRESNQKSPTRSGIDPDRSVDRLSITPHHFRYTSTSSRPISRHP